MELATIDVSKYGPSKSRMLQNVPNLIYQTTIPQWQFMAHTHTHTHTNSFSLMQIVEIKVQFSPAVPSISYVASRGKWISGLPFSTVTGGNYRHRHQSHVSLSSFSRALHHHVRPTVSKNSDHKMAATASPNLHKRNSCLAGDETDVLQIAPPRTTMFLQYFARETCSCSLRTPK